MTFCQVRRDLRARRLFSSTDGSLLRRASARQAESRPYLVLCKQTTTQTTQRMNNLLMLHTYLTCPNITQALMPPKPKELLIT